VLQALRPTTEELSFQDLLDYAGIRDACLRILENRAAPLVAPASRPSLDLRLCCTSQAHFLPGATLVVMDEPAVFEAAVDANLDGVASLRRLLKDVDAKRAKKETKRDSKAAREEAQGGWEDAEQQILAMRYVVNARQPRGLPRTASESRFAHSGRCPHFQQRARAGSGSLWRPLLQQPAGRRRL
jgi:hypothetical protein